MVIITLFFSVCVTLAAAPNMPSLKTFLEYRSKKSDERLNFSCQKRKVKKKEQTSTVQVANMGEEVLEDMVY